MKMVAYLSGELSNSAKFFSSFANVSSDNANDVKATFGVDETNTWKPWEYSSRITVAKSVEALKKGLAVKSCQILQKEIESQLSLQARKVDKSLSHY